MFPVTETPKRGGSHGRRVRRFCSGKQDVTGSESQKVFWLPRRLFFNNNENKQPAAVDSGPVQSSICMLPPSQAVAPHLEFVHSQQQEVFHEARNSNVHSSARACAGRRACTGATPK